MSTVTLEEVKRWCRVIHSADDVLLQDLIDQAEDEALRFLNRTQPPTLPVDYPESPSSEDIPSSEDPVVASWHKAVCMLVEAAYQTPKPEDQAKIRSNAETPPRGGCSRCR
jgi:hypothetical protein